MTASDPADRPSSLVVRRVIRAPRERVFDAWLDPSRLASFMRPSSVSRAIAEVDPRVGGHFRIVMYHPTGTPRGVEHTGEYLLIDRPARLVFSWRSENTGNRSTTVTIDFNEHDEGTEVVLTHRELPPEQVETHRNGWSDVLGHLATGLVAEFRDAR